MSDIKNPILLSVIANAVGFAYFEVTDPERIELREDGERMVMIDEDSDEMEVINQIAVNVYEHLAGGKFLEEWPGEK